MPSEQPDRLSVCAANATAHVLRPLNQAITPAGTVTGSVPFSGELWQTPAIDAAEYRNLRDRLHDALIAELRQRRIAEDLHDPLCCVYLLLAAWVDRIDKPDTLVLGINGAQGSGKSTLSAFLNTILSEGYGYRVAGFSMDDLYKPRAERARLAAEIHPLLQTRGVPGTHDIDLGLAVLDALAVADPSSQTRIPAFDKAQDDRRPVGAWPVFNGRADIVIIDGWCLGARPQPESALIAPINELEASEDVDGTWRRYVNGQLAGDYSRLFARLDKLIMLKAPGMKCVHRWRGTQEGKLAAAAGSAGPNRIMNDAQLGRFIMHYERLTLDMLEELPQRADLVSLLDEQQRFTHICSPALQSTTRP